jgi:hypothetical protein
MANQQQQNSKELTKALATAQKIIGIELHCGESSVKLEYKLTQEELRAQFLEIDKLRYHLI